MVFAVLVQIRSLNELVLGVLLVHQSNNSMLESLLSSLVVRFVDIGRGLESHCQKDACLLSMIIMFST